MITPEQILELAKTCGFEEFIGEKDDETDGVYYQFWEEQMIDFAQRVAEIEYERGYTDGWDREKYSGLVGDPQ